MADLGFLPVVTRILAATPADGQRLLFSATLDNGVDKLVKRFLHDPKMHSVDEANSPVAQMTHHVFEAASTADKNDLVRELASGTGRRILFMRTKHQAKKLAKKLTAEGVPAVDLHGNLSQAQRDRNLAAFGGDGARVLVATDVAARGVHVDGVELVVHVDPPAEHKAYLHRSGRTARAGSEGDVVTICLPEQRGDLRKLLNKAKIDVKPQRVDAKSAVVDDLVGERAAYVKPEPVAAAPQRSGGRPSGNRGSGRSSNGRSGGARNSGARRGNGEGGQARRTGGSPEGRNSNGHNASGRPSGGQRGGASKAGHQPGRRRSGAPQGARRPARQG